MLAATPAAIVRRARASGAQSNTKGNGKGLTRAPPVAKARTGGENTDILEARVAVEERHQGGGVAGCTINLPVAPRCLRGENDDVARKEVGDGGEGA